jgi:hypothetical protein
MRLIPAGRPVKSIFVPDVVATGVASVMLPLAVADKVPALNESPEPTAISSIAPVDAVVLPSIFAVDIVMPVPVTAPLAAAPRFDLAVAAELAPVPPSVTARSVPDQSEPLIVDAVERLPSPSAVLAAAAVVAELNKVK